MFDIIDLKLQLIYEVVNDGVVYIVILLFCLRVGARHMRMARG